MNNFYCAMCGKDFISAAQVHDHLLNRHEGVFREFAIDPDRSIIKADKNIDFFLNGEYIGKWLTERVFLWKMNAHELSVKYFEAKQRTIVFNITDDKDNNYSFEDFIDKFYHCYAIFQESILEETK